MLNICQTGSATAAAAAPGADKELRHDCGLRGISSSSSSGVCSNIYELGQRLTGSWRLFQRQTALRTLFPRLSEAQPDEAAL